MSKKRIVRVLAIALAVVLISSALNLAHAVGEEQLVIPDLLIGKPLGFVTLGLGTLTWAITLPVTIPFGWQRQARKHLVDKPYRFTFERGLGEDLDRY